MHICNTSVACMLKKTCWMNRASERERTDYKMVLLDLIFFWGGWLVMRTHQSYQTYSYPRYMQICFTGVVIVVFVCFCCCFFPCNKLKFPAGLKGQGVTCLTPPFPHGLGGRGTWSYTSHPKCRTVDGHGSSPCTHKCRHMIISQRLICTVSDVRYEAFLTEQTNHHTDVFFTLNVTNIQWKKTGFIK